MDYFHYQKNSLKKIIKKIMIDTFFLKFNLEIWNYKKFELI